MHLMYYLNEKGERVYTLKKSGEEEQPTLGAPRASAPTTSSARSASRARSASVSCPPKPRAL